MKEFNIEEAKAGKPVCTRDGRLAVVIDDTHSHSYPILAAVRERDGKTIYCSYTYKGEFFNVRGEPSQNDLFMSEQETTGQEYIEVVKMFLDSIIILADLIGSPYRDPTELRGDILIKARAAINYIEMILSKENNNESMPHQEEYAGTQE